MSNNGKYTAVVSDLHLTEAEPIHPKHPLWKKFKTKEFFFDSIFCDFLKEIERKAHGQPVELVLNGDIFDFDSVMALPIAPTYRISQLEKQRGLLPRPERSKFKIQVILRDHKEWILGVRQFILKGNNIVFVIGNHDLEMHYTEVQEEIINSLDLPQEKKNHVRFADWFYISNADTLIEHGNQYDPYCTCEDPINPFSQGYNYRTIRLPFGNLACRYLLNGMGFFNPHVDKNYIMSLKEYVRFFLRYIARAQPDLVLVWLWGSFITLVYSFLDQLNTPMRDPLRIEDRVNDIAMRANAEPRMVRELRELFVEPASKNPWLIAKELWLDRAFIIFVGFLVIAQAMLLIRQVYSISFFWAFIPLFLLIPFFLFYSKSIRSMVSSYKEPDERILTLSAGITRVSRVIYGHTHHARHEVIGAVEHLNSGTWSPAFLDVECTRSIDRKTYIWIMPKSEDPQNRDAFLMTFDKGKSHQLI